MVLALAAPAPAQGPVVELGSGTQPAVVLDAVGTAHIAWIGVEPTTTTLHFCRIPRGGTACDVNQTVPVPGTSLTRPFVLVEGTTVHLFSYRYGLTGDRFDAIYRLTSTDGGATFDAGTQVGVLPFADAVRGPGSTVSTIADNSGRFQNFSLNATARSDAVVDLNPNHPYTPALAMHGGRPVAVAAAGSGEAQFRVASETASPNEEAAWSPGQPLGVARYGRFAFGTRTFLLSDGADGTQNVREYLGGDGWAAPVVLPGPTKESAGGTHDIALDPAARLHAVWPMGDAQGAHVGYAVSDDGVAWKVGKFDVANPTVLEDAPGAMRVAVNADHLGVLVFDNGGGERGRVRAVPIGPEPAAPAVTPAPAPTPAPSPPAPVQGKSVTAEATRGTVRVKLPGAKRYVPLSTLSSVPVGATFDTRKGTVKLNGAAEFFDGLFVVRQKTSHPLVDLVLSGGGFKACPRARRATAAARRNRTVRRLWGRGKGRFRTSGKYASATVRGTTWLTADRCDGTLVQVRSGVVSVRDKRRRRTVTVKARRSYLARAPR